MPNTNDLPWEQISAALQRKSLAEDDSRNFRFDILKIAPNTDLKRHKHLDIEWAYVLEGEFHDEFGSYPKGFFKYNPKNSIHSSSTGPEGCEILLCWTGKLEVIDGAKDGDEIMP